MLDTQGRQCLMEELVKLTEYEPGKVYFNMEDDYTYRLVPEGDLCDCFDKIAGVGTIDEKNRVIVPKQIRELYSKQTIVLADRHECYLFIRFMEKKNTQLYQLMLKLEEHIARKSETVTSNTPR